MGRESAGHGREMTLIERPAATGDRIQSVVGPHEAHGDGDHGRSLTLARMNPRTPLLR